MITTTIARAAAATKSEAIPAIPGKLGQIRIRPVRPEDARELQRFYARLSPESRLRRFLGATSGLSDRQTQIFCLPDHRHDEGFVAVLPAGRSVARGRGRPSELIVGHLCLEPDGVATAEVAIAVADEWQGYGIGRRLVDAGLDWARGAGITTFTATMFVDNPAIHRLLRGLGLRIRSRFLTNGVSEIRIDLESGAGPVASAA
jgi:acetyltransferase